MSMEHMPAPGQLPYSLALPKILQADRAAGDLRQTRTL